MDTSSGCYFDHRPLRPIVISAQQVKMRTLFSAALMALLSSNLAMAGLQRRTVTISACEASPNPQPTLSVPIEPNGGSTIASVVVLTTITLLPVPMNTGDPYPRFPTGKGIPSGIFYPGLGTGTGAARPTGYPKYRNHTHHHHPTASSGSNSVPFFTLTNTGTLPLPTPIASPEFTLTNTGSLALPNSISTDCPDMSSTTQSSASMTPGPETESYSAPSPSTALATYPSYRRRRVQRTGRLREGR